MIPRNLTTKMGDDLKMNKKMKPGIWIYGIGVSIFLIGIAFSICFLVYNLLNLQKSSTRVVVPSKTNIVLNKQGKYTIFYEYQSVIDNKIYSTKKSDVYDLTCNLINNSTGEKIPLSECTISSNYNTGSRKGSSLMSFNISKPGTYTLSAFYGNNKNEPRIVLAVTVSYAFSIIVLVLKFLGMLLLTVILSIIILYFTYKKRKKLKSKNLY